MWYCEKCGKRNDSHSRFCTACGSSRQKGRARGPVILVSVLAGVVLIAAALILPGVIPLERAVSSAPDTEEGSRKTDGDHGGFAVSGGGA